ncbi:hypothetical protein DYB25_007885 [Aphanomyces astaci]|uniref:Peptidase C1A papain C-terminal domain-containing protein n=1 Tax=Aphanomyces astaci TaxID=112090 RepID=A0A397C0Z3_APHAT|nr:hypothetical protein DYB36_005794 [Aphanomyces astaci]RHY33743.1 hypothetical protein DYB25_007885 [Aphanomyces astaci]RHY47882.1 hypothetical protein DYB38_010261 [Aphanomyces astaci]RHY62494.1 hypothetical protein DYB34_009567 [Aphanomyces astaci]RHY73743.1 hypothetical protein DYB30_011322 [Aphanomyces astaci]
MLVHVLSFVAAASAAASTTSASSHTFATLVECTSAGGCLWQGKQNELVNDQRILHDMLVTYHRGDNYDVAKRNLKAHIEYIEAVYTHANDMNHDMTIQLGLNPRHLYEDTAGLGDPLDAVLVNMQGKVIDRRLQASTTSTSTASGGGTLPATLNWCTDNNPQKRSVCSEVKSQKLCGSCWAFAATDLIETAVSYTTKNAPVSLSSQQLLSCSTTAEVRTYTYCFARSGNIPTWLEPSMKWDATNKGCAGGMTHIALSDAANKIKNLATRIDWPYNDAYTASSVGAPVQPTSSSFSTKSTNTSNTSNPLNSCDSTRPAANTAAHISGWAPALDGSSCTDTKDPVVLLKRALQQGPVGVALNAKGTFKQYKAGVFVCGAITSSDQIDHAILLVGYGTAADGSGYWILKNSYDVDWGISGYMWLKMDDGLNCGLNVFPIRVQGASAGPAANVTVDGGGSLTFAGASMTTWVVVGVATGIATLVLTIVGVCVARSRMQSMHL